MTSDRAVPHQPAERVLDQALGFGVERARRLVEDQDRRVLEQRARDRDALALAAREQRAAFADLAVEALRHALDELHRVRGARGFLDRFARRARERAVRDVARDRVVEQHDLLPDPGDLRRAGSRCVYVVERLAVEQRCSPPVGS